MSDLDEPRVRCPSCGKNAPAMKYCIYCGAKLPQMAPPTVAPPTSQPPLPPVPPSTAPPTALTMPRVSPPPFSIGVFDEVTNLMTSITALHERKAALLSLFQSGQVSERVFLKLYGEYSAKLKDFQDSRVRKSEETKNQLEEKNRRLSEIGMSLEELEVRLKLGEVDANIYGQTVGKLKAEERELVDSVKALRINIEALEKVLAQKKPNEIRDIELNMRSYQTVLEKLVQEGKISSEAIESVRPDIEGTLAFLDSLIKDRKEKEKNMREQLETLQTRYKVSELSVDEYEKKNVNSKQK